MAELVDAHGSGPCAARRGGSSPLLGTKFPFQTVQDDPETTKSPAKAGFFVDLTSRDVRRGVLVSSGFVGTFVGIRQAHFPAFQVGHRSIPLTDIQVRSLKAEQKPHKYGDGVGLYLVVTPQGSKLRSLACRFGGRQQLLALRSYPAIPLGDARSRRFSARQLLQNRERR